MKRTRDFLQDRKKLGHDLLKKIFIFTLLMHHTMKEDMFFEYLMKTPWFKETVDRYFDSAYETTYYEAIRGPLKKGLVRNTGNQFYTIVKP